MTKPKSPARVPFTVRLRPKTVRLLEREARKTGAPAHTWLAALVETAFRPERRGTP